MNKQLGEILYYNKAKGFGFIRSLRDDASHFFHIRRVVSENGARPIPNVGDLFVFAVAPSVRKPGSLDAVDVTLSKRATPTTAALNAGITGTGEVQA